MKFGFYVSGNATRLRKFLECNKVNVDIAFVLIDSMDNRKLQELSLFNHIPYYEYSYEALNLKKKERNYFISEKLLELMEMYDVSYVFVFASKLLVGNILQKYPKGLINFHPSILPSFPGLNAIDQALKKGSLLLGNTAHFINQNLDDGAIIMQNLYLAKFFSNYDDILDKQIIMLLQLIKWIKEERLIIDSNRVFIKDAIYEIGEYIPSLDLYDERKNS